MHYSRKLIQSEMLSILREETSPRHRPRTFRNKIITVKLWLSNVVGIYVTVKLQPITQSAKEVISVLSFLRPACVKRQAPQK